MTAYCGSKQIDDIHYVNNRIAFVRIKKHIKAVVLCCLYKKRAYTMRHRYKHKNTIHETEILFIYSVQTSTKLSKNIFFGFGLRKISDIL
jgi:hypothetical protein